MTLSRYPIFTLQHFKMGRTKHKNKDKRKCKKVIDEEKEPNKMKRSNKSSAAPTNPPQQPSFASRLKKVQGTADSTPLAPK
jgi:hypothetical protein